jgi:hypothetical protein
MAFDYLFWGALDLDNVAHLHGLNGFDDDFELDEGIPHAHDFPDDASFAMNKDFPNHTQLADNLINTSSTVLISRKLRDFLEQYGTPDVEYLETRIINHKGKEIAERYSIVHPTVVADCIDRKKSQVTEDSNGSIERMAAFALIDANIPDRPIFRVAGLGTFIVVRRDLAAAIDQAGFTGNRWVEASKLANIELPPSVTSMPNW